MPIQGNRGRGEQLRIVGGFRHVERVVAQHTTGECGKERLSTPATIASVSEGEKAHARRRRGRRRGRRSAGSGQSRTANGATDGNPPAGADKPARSGPARRSA